jgi:hypothetical protein
MLFLNGMMMTLMKTQQRKKVIIMTIDNFMQIIGSKRNGAFIKIKWQRELPVYKDFKNSHTVIKIVETVIRKGVNPRHTKIGKEAYKGRENEFYKLPWGQWKSGYEGIILEHKEKYYARFYFTPHTPKVTYLLNGNIIDKQLLQNMNIVTKAGWTELGDLQDFFNVNIDNIISID